MNFGSCAQDFPTPGACCSKSNPATCLATYQANLNDSDRNGACAKVRSALISCDVAAPGFATKAPQDQARCLCYSSGTYNPSSWDNVATSCYASGSSAHPVLYSILTAQSSEALGFCTKYAGPAAVPAATTTVVETETENGSTTVVTKTKTKGGNGGDTDSTETVTATVSSGAAASATAATGSTGSTIATPGTIVSSSVASSTATGTGATTSTATTSGAGVSFEARISSMSTNARQKHYTGMKLKLGLVGLLLPSVLMFAFA